MSQDVTHPPSTERVLFRIKNGGWHEGFFLKDANRYVRNVNRWKDTNSKRWYEDSDVLEWRQKNE